MSNTDTVGCNIDAGIVTSPSLPDVARVGGKGTITMCSSITSIDVPFDLSVTTAGFVNYTGPGRLYVGPTSALFIDQASEGISDLIEGSRSTFVPIIPPLDVAVVRIGDDLVLNLNDETGGQGNAPRPEDNGLILTGSTCMELMPGDSATYRSNNLRIRRGPSVLRNVPTELLQGVLDQTIAGQSCRALTQDAGSRDGAFSGPGLLCTGRSINTGGNVAFYTNSTSTRDAILSDVVNMQLGCDPGVGLVSLIPSNTALVSLAGADSLTFRGATTKELDGDGNVIIRDRFNRVLRSFTCDVTFSCYLLSRLMPAVTTPQSFDLPEGGLSVIFNPDDCSLFAYPTRNVFITMAAEDCRDTLTATPAPAVSFRTETDSFGTTTLTGNGNSLFTISNSRSFPVRSDQFILYQNNEVRILNNNGAIESRFGGISNFSANTAFNRLSFASGSSPNTFGGGGNLYVDNDGRGFFTNQEFVSNLIQTSINNAPQQMVSVVSMTVNGDTRISFQSGGNNLFTYEDVDVTNVGPMQGLVYNSDMLSRVRNVMTVPGDNTLRYFMMQDLVQITDRSGVVSSITGVSTLFVRNGIGGNIEQVSGNVTFPGGGQFIRGSMGRALYLPSGIIDGTAIDSIRSINGLDPIADNVPTSTFHVGNRVQTFRGGSSSLFSGPGMLFRNDRESFYSNNPGFIQNLPGQISALNPADVRYVESNGTVDITSFSGDPIASFSIESRVVEVPSGTLTFSGGNITTSTDFIAGGVQSLTYFDGISSRTTTVPDTVQLPGGGLLVIDDSTEMAFYTTDRRTADRLRNTIFSAMNTFNRPNIPNTLPPILRSKLNKVDQGFGQVLTVYAGADVCLTCHAGNANPPAAFTFFQRTNLNDSSLTVLEESNNVRFVMNGVNNVTLQLLNVSEGVVEYTCEASNSVGTDTRPTLVTTLPGG